MYKLTWRTLRIDGRIAREYRLEGYPLICIEYVDGILYRVLPSCLPLLPPISGLSKSDVQDIFQYIRENHKELIC